MNKNYATQYIDEVVNIIIDRPLGTKHPKHDMIYGVNYGYIPGTTAPDGEGIDAYVLGVDKPLQKFTGKCVAIIQRSNDDDDKLIVVPETTPNISDEEIRNLTHFQEQYFTSHIVRKK